MWGSWAGLFIGIVCTAAYAMIPYIAQSLVDANIMAVIIPLNILGGFGGLLQMTNPLIWVFQWPLMPVVLMTPIFMFLYGWGIHSLFRKFSEKAYMSTTTIVLIVLAIIVLLAILS